MSLLREKSVSGMCVCKNVLMLYFQGRETKRDEVRREFQFVRHFYSLGNTFVSVDCRRFTR
jgi:hypothetical protein